MKKRARAERPIEVAVVGGGCAGIAAAFELSRPQHRGKYHVTVYQLGWRLGGKGASGRGVANRIEEHGLHLWMGFYENAFRLLRECYAELGRDPRAHPMADWRDAFVAEPFIGVGGARSGDRERRWSVHFPPGDGLPGDPLSDYNPFTIASYMVRTATLMQTLLNSAPSLVTKDRARRGQNRASTTRRQRPKDRTTLPSDALDSDGSSGDFSATVSRLLKYGALTTVAGLVSAARFIELVFKTASIRIPDGLITLIEVMAANLHSQFAALAARDPDLQPVWEVIDLLLAFQRGVLRFNLLNDPRGFDALNDYDTRDWLRLNGATERSVNSDMMRGLYDLAMAYEDGDPKQPRMAAGLGLRACLRMFFTYRGAMMWKMQAGMGDVVFAPFYEVLKKRGVSFRFFHRLREVRLGGDATGAAHVAALHFDLQAKVNGGYEYQPLIDRRGLACWPSQPDYDQLVDGQRARAESWNFESHWEERRIRRKILGVGADFDLVVLAIGLGAIPYVCRMLLRRDKRWRAMVRRVKTIPTQAFQIWLREDMGVLGWDELPTTMSGFAKPFDTWADMRHLAVQEDWPQRPRAIIYSCAAMHERPPALPQSSSQKSYAAACRARVRREAVRWLNRHAGDILPNAPHSDGGFRWDLLVDATESVAGTSAQGAARFASQFWSANVNPSDRYVLSIPGSIEYRISPLDYTYDNLTIAGDWTSCGLNVGCVESAFISGRLAAHAIASVPALEEIVGYDHP